MVWDFPFPRAYCHTVRVLSFLCFYNRNRKNIVEIWWVQSVEYVRIYNAINSDLEQPAAKANLYPLPVVLLASPAREPWFWLWLTIGIVWHNAMVTPVTWWRHQMETFSALLAICAGDSPVPGEFPAQRLVMRSFDVFFDLQLAYIYLCFWLPRCFAGVNKIKVTVIEQQTWCHWGVGATGSRLHSAPILLTS